MDMCTLEKRGNLFILTLTGEDEHRLNPIRIDSIRSALNRIRSDPTSHSGSVLITTAHGKFFSNGYDLAWAGSSPDKICLMSSKLRALINDLISFPMPTIAAITGHACAAGLILALSHDYIVMRKDRGFLYMSEMNIGMKFPAWFVTVISCKIGDAAVRREVVLKAEKLTAEQGVERRIVTAAYDSAEETMKGAVELGEKLAEKGWNGEVYSENRKVLYKDVLDKLGADETTEDAKKVAIAASKM
ncbi:enoyl-CoA delta isomerase 1, peroxisomal-like [Durio zibethinus]|uniref:Delta(3)-Delta(2)-enoyl-CoA isomerase n=1 Tax=Durio zibethinus TaxID=66656 RepID=A0A6P5Z1Q7_DURZI|nr:enoyl-CoA delta isomerase 1, peroxisomal-like [Durio zibethinus]